MRRPGKVLSPLGAQPDIVGTDLVDVARPASRIVTRPSAEAYAARSRNPEDVAVEDDGLLEVGRSDGYAELANGW